jgi:hypothetical protein
MKSKDWRKNMVEIQVKSESHMVALDSLRELFATAMEDGVDPDIFMEACLSFALAYHIEFTDINALEAFIEYAKKDMLSSEIKEEVICH